MQDKYCDGIADRFLREARTFINELIEGTNNYRQLYSLSEQFPHDYHDRFLVELIQNANDASTGGEVRIVLDEISNGTPRLYVANQGRPFTPTNFEALCSLGLSDKDPMEAIGNKGLGFRSILQICLEPHIYSAADGNSDEGFNGYCFKLTPSARDVITELINEIRSMDTTADNTSGVIKKYFGVDLPLLSESSRVEKLHSRIVKGDCVVSEEVEYLSPYSFPIPLLDQCPDIEKLYKEGFVTVIELVLNESDALEAVKRAIGNIVSEYLLFTPRLTKLSVEHQTHSDEENLSVVLEKKAVEKSHKFYPPHPITGVQIVRNQGDTSLDTLLSNENNGESPESTNSESRVWWTHTGDITGEELSLSLQELPGKWHEVTRAGVTIALERTVQEPRPGFYSIYLPTGQETGSPVSVNGPFYGNLPRTDINFSKNYNHLLLRKAVKLMIEMLNYISETGSLEDGTAMLDILDCRDTSSILIQLLDKELEDSGTPLPDFKAVYTEIPEVAKLAGHELVPISSIRILPESKQPRHIFIPSRLTQVGGCFPASIIAQNRDNALSRIAERAGSSLTPQDAEIVAWIEKVAELLLKSDTNIDEWNTYYHELSDLNEILRFQNALRTCRFLLTEDQRLVTADGDGPRIFAFPVRTGTLTDDNDEEKEQDSDKPRVVIPSRIKSSVAFFHSSISLIEDGPSRNFNLVGRFLRQGNPPLVRDYETRIIVNEVIIPLVNRASSRKNPSKDTLAQALSWAFQLYLGVTTDTTFSGVMWNRLRVPTVSGWKPASETYFSASWTGTLGHVVEKAFPTGHQALDRLLVSTGDFAKLVRSKSSSLKKDDLAEWVTFLRDQCRVRETPIVRQTSFLRTRLDEGQEHLRMSGQESRYNTSELGNYFNFPNLIWSEYVEYLRNNLEPPIRGWDRYYLEKLTMLEGLVELNPETAVAYTQLVSHGFSRLKDSLSTGVTRRGLGVTVSSAKADSSLAFVLKRFSWLPCVDEDEKEIIGLVDPSHVWYVPPDVLDSTQSRMRYSFVRHLPREVASSMTDDFRHFIGLRSIKISSAEEGLLLLSDLASSWKAELAPERHQYFIDLWRETLVETARMWEGLSESERGSVLERSRERGFTGLLVVPAGRRFPDWRDLDSEEELATITYLPDEVQLQSSMGEWIDIVEMRGEPIGSQVNMLKSLFGSRVACISELELVPESDSLPEFQEQVDAASYLTSRFQWLEAFTLTIYGLGRRLEMNITGDPFRRVARDFRRLKYLEVPGLHLRIKDLDTKKSLLSPTSYYWDKNKVLLLNPESASGCEDLVAGLCAFFGVQDIENPLRLALSKLGHSLDDTEEPDLESQIEALQYLHVSAEQFDRIRRIVISGDDEWISVRLIPAICALNAIKSEEKAREIKESFLELSTNIGIKKALQEMGTGKLGFSNSLELYDLAAEATSDEDTAYKLWLSHKLSLATWNDAIRALGHPYRICRNSDIEEEYQVVMQELKPVMIAILREALKESADKEKYVALKINYDEIEPHAEWKELYWKLPFEIVLESAIDWLKSQVSKIPSRLLKALSVHVENTEKLKSIARSLSLDLDHDDDLLDQQNRQKFERLIESCLVRLLASWIASGNDKSPVPTAVSSARDISDFIATDTIKSICQFEILPENHLMALVIKHLTECAVFEKLGIEKKSWDSYVSLADDCPVTKKQEELAAERLNKIQEYNERRARTRSVLGEEYEMPRGDSFEGLRGVMDKQLSEDLLKQVDLFQDPSLGEAPKPSKSGRRGTSYGRGGGLSSRDRDLIGAIGEYIVYKVLCHQIGISEAGQAWKSRNRRHFLAEDTGDDSLGYDFEFVKDGTKWQFEVKSSSSVPRFIDLTENEVDTARVAAKRRSKKNYVVYLVENALSYPGVYPLGNPFINVGKTKFNIEEGGARVYFKLSKESEESLETET